VFFLDADVEFFLQNQFEKIKLIRQTKKGEVWLATNKAGEFVIFKQINFVGLPYQILKKNPDKLFAKIYFCVEDDNKTFIVEEFLSGENLAERKNFLTEIEARQFILQLCDGLKILHALGIVHRDIKPSNLILQGDKIKLIDFDAARIFSADKSEDTNFLGTKGYAPPEQFGYGQTDPRSDIFSLGKTFQKLLGKNCTGNLKKILLKCTELDPKNRYQTVDELKFALLEKESAKFNLLKIFLLTLSLTITFQKSAVEENFIETNIEVEKNFPEFEKIEEVQKESYKFPEIKMPENNLPSPRKNIETPQKISPEVRHEKNSEIQKEKTPEEVPKKIYKDYVKVTYYWNGKRVNAWTDNFDYDIDNANFSVEVKNLNNFKNLGGESVRFPAWIIGVKVENFTDKNFLNPQVEIIYNDDGRIEKNFLKVESVGSGKTKDFFINLNQFTVTNPRTAGGNYITKHSFTIKFSGTGAKILGTKTTFDFIFKL